MNHKRKWLLKKGEEKFSQEELNKFEDKFEKIMIEAHKQNEDETQIENNLSERGLRGAKSKQKASAQFWSVESASWYATIRTYIETCNRNNVNIYNALVMLCLGKPYSLKEILSGELE